MAQLDSFSYKFFIIVSSSLLRSDCGYELIKWNNLSWMSTFFKFVWGKIIVITTRKMIILVITNLCFA